MKEITRRDALKLIGGLGVGLLAREVRANAPYKWDTIWKFEHDRNDELSFYEASQLASRFDRAVDLMDNLPLPENVDEEYLWGVVNEIAPIYQYLGMVRTAKTPTEAEFTQWQEGWLHVSIAGMSDCYDYVHINDRFTREYSSWYGDTIFHVIAHETAHINQGIMACTYEPIDLIETTAQIMSLEAESFLANEGNDLAFYSVVRELRTIALGAAYSAALKAEHSNWYDELRNTLKPGAREQAEFDQRKRGWAGYEDKHVRSLDAYYTDVLTKLIASTQTGQPIEDLALQPFKGEKEPPNVKIDNLSYLVEHMMEKAAQIHQENL